MYIRNNGNLVTDDLIHMGFFTRMGRGSIVVYDYIGIKHIFVVNKVDGGYTYIMNNL